jgi:hypothetical protein
MSLLCESAAAVPVLGLEKLHQKCAGLVLDSLEVREVARDSGADLLGHPLIA